MALFPLSRKTKFRRSKCLRTHVAFPFFRGRKKSFSFSHTRANRKKEGKFLLLVAMQRRRRDVCTNSCLSHSSPLFHVPASLLLPFFLGGEISLPSPTHDFPSFSLSSLLQLDFPLVFPSTIHPQAKILFSTNPLSSWRL